MNVSAVVVSKLEKSVGVLGVLRISDAYNIFNAMPAIIATMKVDIYVIRNSVISL